MTQQEALDILKMGYSSYITGEAGTGKTYALNEFIGWLRGHGIEPAVTASTGIAATHLGGSTIHSWSGIGVRDSLTKFDLDRMEQKKNLWQRFENARILIIDEISMLSAYFLDMCDKVCRHMKRDQRPFGGMQVIFCGDFFQLPPISKNGARAPYAFESQAWRELNPVTCYLTKQYRQNKGDFSSLLSSIRSRLNIEEVRKRLAQRQNFNPPKDREITRLFTHNIDVDALNAQRLSALSGKDYVFEMQARGRKRFVEILMRGCLAPQVLRLKKDAEVMFVKNDRAGNYVNGTQGKIIGFAPDETPVVQTRGGKKIYAASQRWRMEEGDKVLAEITQIPLRLAWAITVHKSQGMTLDEAEMDLSRSFAPGQGYVALSRVRTFEGLFLNGFNDIALAVDGYVAERDDGFREHSRGAVYKLGLLGKDKIKTRQDKFIISSGGSLETREPVRIKEKERIPTKEQTRRLLENGLAINEVARARNLAQSTIVSHAEALVRTGAKFNFSYLAPSSKIKIAVEKAVSKTKSGFEYLAPIKEQLEKQGYNIPYDKLREIRLYLRCIQN